MAEICLLRWSFSSVWNDRAFLLKYSSFSLCKTNGRPWEQRLDQQSPQQWCDKHLKASSNCRNIAPAECFVYSNHIFKTCTTCLYTSEIHVNWVSEVSMFYRIFACTHSCSRQQIHAMFTRDRSEFRHRENY